MQPGRALSPADSAAIDGLRGLAALFVVASHASLLGLHWLPGLSLAGIGKYGVYLFFVISAFLLTLQWLQAPPGRGDTGRALARYLVRRVLRIFPLYVAVLLLGWALAPRGLGVPLDGAAVWQHLTLREGRDIYWSVPVEFKYYLAIPLLAWGLAAPLAPAWKALALAAMGGLALQLFPPAQAALNSIALSDYLVLFLCGSAAAWVFHGGTVAAAPPGARAWHVADLAVLLLLALTVPAVLRVLGLNAGAEVLHREFAAWGLFWSLLLLAMLRGYLPGWAAMLRLTGMRACGRWCFGIYLLHMPALYLARRLPVPEIGQGWLGLALAVAVAALAFALIERPAMRWAGRITRPAVR
jgi:peptidoglycan/LPS O-acetylase OafA/YrhL